MHAKADADNDGFVTRKELSAHIQRVRGNNAKGRAGGGSGSPPPMAEIFRNFDRNGDSRLTKGEVPAPVWVHLSAADENEDGAVTEAEFEAARAAERDKEPLGAKDGD